MPARRFFYLSVVAACLILLGCTSTPPTPAPVQYFADAKKNLDSLDYEAALKNLDRMIAAAGDQPIGQQGIVLRTALLTALAEGTKQMAETYGEGMKKPPAQARQAQFVRMRSDYYGICRVRLLSAMESGMKQRTKLGDKAMELQVNFPGFTGTQHPAISRIRDGYWVEDAERYRAELESVRNALARTLARLVGAGDDVHKGRTMFEKGSVQIAPAVYLFELSTAFRRLSEIFERRGLDDASYRRTCLEVVRDNLDATLKLLQAKPDKELEARAKKLKEESEKTLKSLSQ